MISLIEKFFNLNLFWMLIVGGIMLVVVVLLWTFVRWVINCISFYKIYCALIKAQLEGDIEQALKLKRQVDYLKAIMSTPILYSFPVSFQDIKLKIEDVVVYCIFMFIFIFFIIGRTLNLTIVFSKTLIHNVIIRSLVSRRLPLALVCQDPYLRDLASKLNKKKIKKLIK